MQKMEDLMATTKLKALLKKEEEKKSKMCWVLVTILAVAAVAGIAYALYKYLTPKYYDEFDDDFDYDEFDDDFFEDTEAQEINTGTYAEARYDIGVSVCLILGRGL